MYKQPSGVLGALSGEEEEGSVVKEAGRRGTPKGTVYCGRVSSSCSPILRVSNPAPANRRVLAAYHSRYLARDET